MVDFARASRINRVLEHLPGCIGAPSTRTEPCGDVATCLQCWFRKQMTLASAQPPATPLPAPGDRVYVTLDDLQQKYGSVGKAAGALALGIETMPAGQFMDYPEAFRSLVLYKQNVALIRLAAIAAGTSLQRLQNQWYAVENEERDGAS